MNRIKSILALVAVGGLVLFAVVQYQGIATLRAENSSLKAQLEQLTQAQADRDSASHANAPANALSAEQQAELLKLRGEVTQLRGQTNEIAALRQQNDALRTSVKVAASAAATPVERKKKTADDALPQDIHPKDSWGFRGYGSPDATVESMLWSASQGDKAGFMAGFSPELQEKFQKDFAEKDFSEEVRKNEIGEFRVLDRQVVSDDEMVVTVYTARQKENGETSGNSEDTHFKKIDGQWKLFEK
jgi:hypothetical protein